MFRAANRLLRDALNGRCGALLSFYPSDPKFSAGTGVTYSFDTASMPFTSGSAIQSTTTSDAQTSALNASKSKATKDMTNRELRIQASDCMDVDNDTNNDADMEVQTSTVGTSGTNRGGFAALDDSESDE